MGKIKTNLENSYFLISRFTKKFALIKILCYKERKKNAWIVPIRKQRNKHTKHNHLFICKNAKATKPRKIYSRNDGGPTGLQYILQNLGKLLNQ